MPSLRQTQASSQNFNFLYNKCIEDIVLKEKIAQLKSKLSGGVAPAMATPLQADGYAVNRDVVPQLADFLIEKGASGLFVGGTTGEGILLPLEQRMILQETAVSAVNKRVPVILQTGTNNLADTITLTQHAQAVGADAIAVVTPFFYGMHDEGLAAYYRTIAETVPEIPLLLYDIPHLAVNGISPALLAHLGNHVPSVAGVKCSRPNAQIVRQLIAAAPAHTMVLAGNEAIALGSLAMGADGLISGLSTAVPEPFVALTQAVTQGRLAEAQQIHDKINQMLAQMPAGARIGGIKQILADRGIPMGTAVPPRPMPTKPIWPHIEAILNA